MASFDEFLRTGQIGRLTTGLTRDAVREFLGDPGDTSVRKKPEIWKYGPMELVFYRIEEDNTARLTSIAFQMSDPAPLPASLRLTGWMPTSSTTFDQFLAYLDESGMRVGVEIASEPARRIVLESGSKVCFDDEGRLANVNFTARAEAERKQLSISVPQDDWQALNRAAKARGISASALCSLWIGEQVMSLKTQEA